jgi:hypothetical protein
LPHFFSCDCQGIRARVDKPRRTAASEIPTDFGRKPRAKPPLAGPRESRRPRRGVPLSSSESPRSPRDPRQPGPAPRHPSAPSRIAFFTAAASSTAGRNLTRAVDDLPIRRYPTLYA